MTRELILVALILSASVVFLVWRLWCGLRGKPSCNCGCCDKVKKVRRPR
ncbi:MAG: hypothetical protein LBV54_06010 [Puniceicoccales bacterium]|nr:hypothetical protein [Puniceicoccales bacterium]